MALENECNGRYRRVVEINEGFLYYCSEPKSCLDCNYLVDPTDVTNQTETVRYCRWRDGSEQMLNFPRKNWC